MSWLWTLWFDQERPVSSACPAIAPPSSPCRSIMLDSGSSAQKWKKLTEKCRPRVTISMLPDVALLKVFDFFLDDEDSRIEDWHTLVHVCRSWRDTVLGSPRRLNLRLRCGVSTRVRNMLSIWPLLPIKIAIRESEEMRAMDNVIAALELKDRICGFDLFYGTSSEFQEVLAAMQQPFPALTDLRLWSKNGGRIPVVPASFLGGSAPCLQELRLGHIRFPGLRSLLLSTTHLVSLTLWNIYIPHSGYILPETMAAYLSVLPRLEKLDISPHCGPNEQSPPPQTRTLLPALTDFRFSGVCEYLEGFVAQVDAPLLHKLDITFSHQPIFDTLQLAQFISRTPNFNAQDEARLEFFDAEVRVRLLQKSDEGPRLILGVSCNQSDRRLSFLAQVCSSAFPQALILMVERLYIVDIQFCGWQDKMENIRWLELLQTFTSVKDLYISRAFSRRVAPAVKELIGERVTDVLPALQTLFLEGTPPTGHVQEIIGKFVAERRLAGHPVVISRWECKRFER